MRYPLRLVTPAALRLLSVLALCGAVACGDSDNFDETLPGGDEQPDYGADSDAGMEEPDRDDGEAEPPAEIEEQIVERVAATDRYIFVPTGREDGDQVALIDGETFQVEPIRVGLNPQAIVAAEVEGVGAVAYVWSEGTSTVAIVRADMRDSRERPDVRVVRVPREVNQLAVAPGGRYALAYIDPELPLPTQGSAVSLQTMALIALGDAPGEDEAYQLSVTRRIESLSFSDDGRFGFIVGEEGISRIEFEDIKADAFVPTLDLGAATQDFPPRDQEAAFSADASRMILRSSQLAGLGLFELAVEEHAVASRRMLPLPGVPTDVELLEREVEGELRREVLFAMRERGQVGRFDLDQVMAAESDEAAATLVELIDVEGVEAGIARLTPDEQSLLVFSTLPPIPSVGLLDVGTGQVQTVALRNQIRTLALSPDSETAVVVHRAQPGSAAGGASWEDRFRYAHGLSLWDLATGYVRPVVLQAEPQSVLMVESMAGPTWLYGMLANEGGANFGVVRISLETFAVEVLPVPRRPAQIGVVADQVFVTQEDGQGRVTFFDIETGTQRTVSGFELNAEVQ
ncbi:hypothetical protein DV096_10505 [Bradymonadaceae bacterium TMQ3]|nr:hypothetical protein DV096_10505 [Bradymonadaceae bacterium TMQ3]TXC75905.1 hypothetical protein FRC91_10410 [Bradymonadales bacterium TMQ1]